MITEDLSSVAGRQVHRYKDGPRAGADDIEVGQWLGVGHDHDRPFADSFGPEGHTAATLHEARSQLDSVQHSTAQHSTAHTSIRWSPATPRAGAGQFTVDGVVTLPNHTPRPTRTPRK
jgi:hypothetical protein